MHDSAARKRRERQKEQIKQRYNVVIDPENYEYIPAKKQVDYYDNEVNQRVAIYVRVSTDDVRQTTSYELQKKYYEEFVTRHPNWTLVNIYADEGISGTSLKHRDEFNRMIADCRAGKIDMIVTKSVSRFARNVEDFIGTVRSLAERRPPVGVFFESEAIFSLNDDSQMALTFQATMAEEESHTRSRSMETSLRMRLDHGVPLTPKLFGYTHDADGHLQINPEEASTVKLIFYMYLYGYSTKQIADALTKQERSTYFGKSCWLSSGIVSILRNERHCGDVLTRKTITENYRTHRSLKNRGEKPQSRYYNHHDAIIRRDDFNAVQRMLDNAKYYMKTGVLKAPCHFQFIMGAPGGMAGTVENLVYLHSQLPEGSTWSASGLSKAHIPVMLTALALGGHIRVGLEDNVYYSHGILAKSNSQLVQRAAEIIRAAGFGIATPDEARKILGIKNA